MEIGIAYRNTQKQSSFEDIFDGQGYCLSNLTLTTPEERNRFGVFGSIGENGIVRNLHIQNSSIHICEKTGIGFIAGENWGTITNCSVKNVSITRNSQCRRKRSWSIASNNLGYIANCTTEDFYTEASVAHIGGLIGVNQGFLLNSYSANL